MKEKTALSFQTEDVGVRLNIETFPGIPKELVHIILGLNAIHIGVIGLLLNCWVTLVDWMTFLLNSEMYNSFPLAGR